MQNHTAIQEWIDALKIALLEQNANQAFKLTQNLPFTHLPTEYDKELLESLEIAKELISQTIQLLQFQQDETRKQLNQMRQARKFLI